MMAERITVFLDRSRQVICQSVIGPIDKAGSRELAAHTAAAAEGLMDRWNLRICLDARQTGKIHSKARREMMENLKREDVCKLALWGGNAYLRAAVHFIRYLEGGHKIRAFRTREEALAWLAE